MSDYYSRDRTPASVSWQRLSGPEYEIITVAEARHHLRLESYGGQADTDEDAYLTDLIATAGDAIETHVRRPIRDQQRELVIRREDIEDDYDYGGWWWGSDGAITLNTTPIRSVDGITFYDGNERRTVADTARRVVGTGEGIERNVQIFAPYGESWPWWDYSWDEDSDIRITVTCGYTQANLPPAMKHAARILVHDWYAQRGQTIVGTISATVGRSLDYLLAQHTREVFR